MPLTVAVAWSLRGGTMSCPFEHSQPEKRQHQLLLNLFAFFMQLIVFNKANSFLKCRKMSFVFIWEQKGKRAFPLTWARKQFIRSDSTCVYACVRGGGRVCVGVCLHSWKLESKITSPGGGSWGVHCDPIKSQTGSGSLSRKEEDFAYKNIPVLDLKKQAKSLQTPPEFT